MNKAQYAEYLQSDHWQETRRRVLEKRGCRCQLCGATDVQFNVHHNSYENLGNEQWTDLVVLCHECHGRHHGKMPRPSQRNRGRSISPRRHRDYVPRRQIRRAQIVVDAEQCAWVHILEVLLNEPALMRCADSNESADRDGRWTVGLRSLFSERISNPQHRRIAAIVLELAPKAGESYLDDVIDRAHRSLYPGDIAEIVELVARGRPRGNYEETLRLAFKRIEYAIYKEGVETSKRNCMVHFLNPTPCTPAEGGN